MRSIDDLKAENAYHFRTFVNINPCFLNKNGLAQRETVFAIRDILSLSNDRESLKRSLCWKADQYYDYRSVKRNILKYVQEMESEEYRYFLET